MITTKSNRAVPKDVLVAITEVNADAVPWPVAIGEDGNQAEYRVDLRIQPAGGLMTIPKVGESWWITIVAGHWALSRRMLRATELEALTPGDMIPEVSTGLVDNLDVRYGDLISEISDLIDELAAVPGWSTGDFKASSRTVDHNGWLVCDGRTNLLIADYPDLGAHLGTTFGGNGTTTFGVPDFRGRTLIGLDNLGGSSANRITAAAADSLGGTGGVESVALAATEMPVHTHTQTAHTHTQSGHSHTVDSHTHSIPSHGHTASGYTDNEPDHKHNFTSRSVSAARATGGSGGLWEGTGTDATADGGAHSHSVTVTVNDASAATSGGPSASGTSNVTPPALGDATPAIQNAGGSGGVTQAHANTQPWMAVGVLIKT